MESDPKANAEEAHQDTGAQSVFPSLQELRDLPQRLLPEETYTHLQNAGREALLALYSLWQGIDKARNTNAGGKVRKRIDVE